MAEESKKTGKKFKEKTKKSLVKKIKNWLKKKTSNILFKLRNLLLNTIYFIINIDIGFMFLFAATYLFDINLTWYERLIGAFGLYHFILIMHKKISEWFTIMKR